MTPNTKTDSARQSNGAADEDPHRQGATLRRSAMGSNTARRLLMTVMGEFMLPLGGVAWTSTVLDALGRLGVEPGTVRQALARTAHAGWLTRERIGRVTRWRLTPGGERLLTEGAKRIYEFSGPTIEWDGRWLVVLASVSESDRSQRHLLRTRLSWAGLGTPSPGVWVGTHASKLAEVKDVLAQTGLVGTAHVFVAEHVGTTDAKSIVSDAWDLEGIEAEYEGFLAEFASSRTSDALSRLVELVDAWRQFPWQDPALPRQLLPGYWKGAEAAQRFQRRYQSWKTEADAEWSRIVVESEARLPEIPTTAP